MLKMTYTNHLGEEIKFGEGNILVNQSDVRDYKKNYKIVNDKVEDIEDETRNPQFDVFIFGPDRKNIANHFYEAIDIDAIRNKNGILNIGDYYLDGYFVGNKKVKYANSILIHLQVEFVAGGKWYKQEKKSYIQEEIEDSGLDFAYDFDYDFTLDKDNHLIVNSSFIESDFVMKIMGEVSNPTITIADHIYSVNADVDEGEYLVINSKEKTISLVKANGEIVNMFYARNRDNYIFEKIPVGRNSVEYNEDLNFEITLLDERSEPKWI